MRASGVRFGVVSCLAILSLASSRAAAQALTTVRVADGLSLPLLVTHAPGESGRAFIVEQRSGTTGRIRVLDLNSGTLLATPFLSVPNVTTGGEQGLLGLAFHPDYQNNGLFYVDYTAAGGGAAGHTVVAEYRASPPGSNTAIATPVRTILTIDQPEENHNGGWIGFGPDGFLYIATGDGGGGGDQHGTIGNGQDLSSNLGKMLRVDVNGDDFPADTARNYRIPASNPFVGIAGNDEIWAFGLRNPWRNSFDRVTGDLWIGDVGQGSWEEIDFQPAGAAGGRNYGWRCMEGFHCTGWTGCTCNDTALTLPIHEYGHGPECSLTGGYVYRGCAVPDLAGTYFFGDFCSAKVWSFRYDLVNGKTEFTDRTAELAPGGGLAINTITSFGEDGLGEIYICDQGGEVFKIVPRSIAHDCNNNGRADACDITLGISVDANGDGRPDECCPSDIDDNGFVNGDDFDTWIYWFVFGDPRADYNHDTFVSGDDFDLFVNDFIAGC